MDKLFDHFKNLINHNIPEDKEELDKIEFEIIGNILLASVNLQNGINEKKR